jgi:hypothetical protein
MATATYNGRTLFFLIYIPYKMAKTLLMMRSLLTILMTSFTPYDSPLNWY